MTDLPSQQEMSPEQKAISKIELQQLNDLADKATGRVIPIGQPWHTERNLSKETKAALDSLEPKQPQKPESPLYKLPEGMDQKLKNFDEVIKNRPSPKPFMGPISAEDRLIAWHKSLGSPDRVLQAELKQLRAQQTGGA